MSRRTLLLGVAVAVAVLGLAIVFVPGFDAVAPSPSVLPTVVGVLAVLAGLRRAWRWLRRDVEETEPPVRERGQPMAVPGDEFDALLVRTPGAGSASGDRRAVKAKDELESVAVDVLVVYRGLSEAEARAQLREGTWTDDPLAAEFFTHIHGTGSSVTESVAGAFRDEGPFHRRAGRAASAIARVVENGGEA